MESVQQNAVPAAPESRTVDPVICFCFRVTERKLREAYRECGSLEKVKECTRAGTACRGCLTSLSAMFNQDIAWDAEASKTSSCLYSGQSVMKALVLSVEGLETRALAANAPAPQLNSCNLDGNISYSLVDGAGQRIFRRTQPISTFHNFLFDTATEMLPKPFVGQLIYEIDRKNRGSGRLGTQWYSPNGVAATHENSSTGRPRVFVPITLDKQFRNGPNRLYLAIVNPHEINAQFDLNVFNRGKQVLVNGSGTMGPYNSLWVDASESLFKPLEGKIGDEPLYIGLETRGLNIHAALSCYFFLHNLSTGAWSCQHL